MADGVDWSLLKTPDFVGDYQNAFQVGRQLAAQRGADAANAQFATDPQGAINAMRPYDPAQAESLQQQYQARQDRQGAVQQATAEAAGDLPGAMNAAAARGATGDVATLRAQIDALPEQQRQAAAAKAQQTNEAFAHVLIGLKGATNSDGSPLAPPQRLAVAQHMAQTTGLMDPSRITLDDVSDAGINGHLASAMTVEQALKSYQATAELGEKTSHDRATEANAAGELGVNRGRLGVESARLGLERQKFAATQPQPPVIAPAGSAGGGPGSPGGGLAARPTLAQIPAADQPIVQAMVDGRYDIPKGAALRNPAMVRYLQEAAAIDPTFDAANPASRIATRKDFTSGKSAQTITSLNQALGHGALVAQDIGRLDNSGLPLVGGAYNATKNFLTDPVTGNATTFRAHATALANEAAKVFQGGAPHEAEVRAQSAILANADASPVQQRAAVQALTELLGARLDAMRSQYVQGMGRSSTPLEVLHPEAAQAYARLSHLRDSLGGHGAAAPAPTAAAPHERVYNPHTGRLE